MSTGTQSPTWDTSYRARLTRFFAKYAPSNSDNVLSVDDTLQRAKGKEERLFANLVKTYGPEPTPDEDVSAPQQAPWAPVEYGSSPSSLFLVPQSPRTPPHEGGGMPALSLVSERTPSVGHAHTETFKTRLTRHFQFFSPENLGQEDAFLARWQGREEEMFQALKYGGLLPTPQSPALAPPRSATLHGPESSAHTQLVVKVLEVAGFPSASCETDLVGQVSYAGGVSQAGRHVGSVASEGVITHFGTSSFPIPGSFSPNANHGRTVEVALNLHPPVWPWAKTGVAPAVANALAAGFPPHIAAGATSAVQANGGDPRTDIFLGKVSFDVTECFQRSVAMTVVQAVNLDPMVVPFLDRMAENGNSVVGAGEGSSAKPQGTVTENPQSTQLLITVKIEAYLLGGTSPAGAAPSPSAPASTVFAQAGNSVSGLRPPNQHRVDGTSDRSLSSVSMSVADERGSFAGNPSNMMRVTGARVVPTAQRPQNAGRDYEEKDTSKLVSRSVSITAVNAISKVTGASLYGSTASPYHSPGRVHTQRSSSHSRADQPAHSQLSVSQNVNELDDDEQMYTNSQARRRDASSSGVATAMVSVNMDASLDDDEQIYAPMYTNAKSTSRRSRNPSVQMSSRTPRVSHGGGEGGESHVPTSWRA